MLYLVNTIAMLLLWGRFFGWLRSGHQKGLSPIMAWLICWQPANTQTVLFKKSWKGIWSCLPLKLGCVCGDVLVLIEALAKHWQFNPTDQEHS